MAKVTYETPYGKKTGELLVKAMDFYNTYGVDGMGSRINEVRELLDRIIYHTSWPATAEDGYVPLDELLELAKKAKNLLPEEKPDEEV